MCLGNNQTTQTQTKTPPAWLTSAATGNLDYVKALGAQGFQGYGGNQVAGFSPEQQQSFYAAGGLAGNILPYTGDIGSLASNAANAGAASVNATPIYQNMSPYMNQYVQQALAPQIQMQDTQFAAQNKGVDSAATMAGAFGDTGWGQLRGTTTAAQDAARTGLMGTAYNNAFNTAVAAGAQDTAFGLNAQTTNANLYETAMQRQLQGANQLYGLGSNVTGLENTMGQQQTAQTQAQLNAQYNQWLMAQQYPFQVAGLMNQTLQAGQAGAPQTTTTSAPNNAGYGLIGAGIGALGTIGGSVLGGPVGGVVGGYLGSSLGNSLMNSGVVNPTSFTNGAGLPYATPSNSSNYAKGGNPPVGKPSLVGERGPEMFVPNQKGTIIPNHELKKLAAKYSKKKPKRGKAMLGGAAQVASPLTVGEAGPEVFVPQNAPTPVAPNQSLGGAPVTSPAPAPAPATAAGPNGMTLPLPQNGGAVGGVQMSDPGPMPAANQGLGAAGVASNPAPVASPSPTGASASVPTPSMMPNGGLSPLASSAPISSALPSAASSSGVALPPASIFGPSQATTSAPSGLVASQSLGAPPQTPAYGVPVPPPQRTASWGAAQFGLAA